MRSSRQLVEDDKDKVVIRIRGMVVDMLLKIAPEVYSTIRYL